MSKRSLPAIILCFMHTLMIGQLGLWDASLNEGSKTFSKSWDGGMNLPQFSAVDLNNDGIKDLVIYDRECMHIMPYLNNGTINQSDYHYAPEFKSRFPEGINNFMLLRDFDCDGLEDIFGMYEVFGQGLGVAVWKASYDSNDTIQFQLVTPQLKYSSNFGLAKLFIYNTDLPSIDDIDGDGDLDILAFSLDLYFPKNVFWYRNTSVEQGYGCDSLEFEIASYCWGLFEESGISSIVNFSPSPDSCYNNPFYLDQASYQSIDKNGRHIGTNLTTIDMDGDSIKELVLGGVSFNNINVISGLNINDTLLMNTQDFNFPSYDQAVDLQNFVSTYFIDVNNDGLIDMLNCPSETGMGEAVSDSVVWMYVNTQSNQNMQFSFQQKDFLVGDMLDIGTRAYPAIFDHNADGKKDLLIGTHGRAKFGNGYFYGLTLLENTSTSSGTSFELVTKDYGNFSNLFSNDLHPSFGDLDGDGDADLILGNGNGTLTYVENVAGAGNPMLWASPNINYMNIDVGDDAAPFLFDLDKDQDLDLLIGKYAGNIYYYENSGSINSPLFLSSPTSINLGGYNVQNQQSRNSMPFVWENDGALEMLIGHKNGNIIHLGNIDANHLGVYDTLSEQFMGFEEGRYTDVALEDLDGDGKIEYIIGTGRGGLAIYSQMDTVITSKTLTSKRIDTKIYPNPCTNFINIESSMAISKATDIEIFNGIGQMIKQLKWETSSLRKTLDVSGLSSGLYYLKLGSVPTESSLKFIKH